MFNFCTLFDSNYLTRSLVLYTSLKKYCKDFHLYIFPFDERCYEILSTMSLDNVTLVPLKDFEDEELLRVKPSRSRGEYCWTCTSSTILYCIEKFGLEHCIYLDADLCFYNSPELLLNEVEGKSVLITEHRYSPKYQWLYYNGKYCVQFMFFRNDADGLKALKWWRNACLDWCYKKYEDGKFGDQKYLDDWTERFKGVVELQHIGGGVAPWNVQQYCIENQNSALVVIDKLSKKKYPLIFYHFHDLRFISKNIICSGSYKLPRKIRTLLYKQYLISLFENAIKVNNYFQINYSELNTEDRFRYLIRFLLRRADIIIRLSNKKYINIC